MLDTKKIIERYKTNKEALVEANADNELLLKSVSASAKKPEIKSFDPSMVSLKQFRALRRGGSHV